MNVEFSSSIEDYNIGEGNDVVLMAKIKQENKKLSKENSNLLNQISKLKKQFDNAVEASSAAESLRSRNLQLEQQLLEANTKKAEVENRLNIALKKIEELQKTTDKRDTSKPPVFNQNYELNEKINNLTNQITNLEDQLAREKSSKFMVQTEMDQIYSVASQCFKLNIRSANSLIENILKYQETKDKHEDSQVEISHLLNKCKKLKKQNKQIDQISQSAINSIRNEKDRINDILKKCKAENLSLNQNINNLQSQISKLEQENISLNSQLKQQQNQTLSSIQELQSKHEPEVEMLKNTIKQEQENSKKLSSELFNLNSKLDSSDKDIKILQEKIAALERKVMKWKGKYKDAQAQLQESIPPPKLEQHAEELRKSLQQNAELNNEIDQLKEHINQKSLIENEFQSKLDDSAKVIKILKKEIKSIAEMNEIPQSVWLHCKVPREISDYIHEVSSNPATKISVKLTQIINSIYEFYKSNNEKWANETEKARNELLNSQKKLNLLTSYLSRLFPDVIVNFEGIADEEKSREILHMAILKWKDAQKETQMQLDELRKSVNVHFGVLGVDSFADARNVVTELIYRAKQLKKENKSLSRKLSQSIDSEELLAKTLKKIKVQNAQISDAINAVQQENDGLRQRVNELENLPPDPEMISEITKQKDELVHYDKVIGDLNLKIQKSLDENANLVHENEQLKSELAETIQAMNRVKAHGDSMKEDVSFKFDELVAKIKQQKHQIKEERQNFSLEMDKFREQSEKIVNSLKSRINELESDLEKANSKNIELATSLKTSETKFAALLDEKEREKKHIESQLQARMNSMSSDYHHQVENAQMNTDLAMKHVMQTLIHAFPFLYNSNSELSISEYENCISILKDKFGEHQQLESQIRSILGISSNDSILKALTQAIKSSYSTASSAF